MEALEQVAPAICHADIDYQHTAEDRRELAYDVDEAVAELHAGLIATGFGEALARGADVRVYAGVGAGRGLAAGLGSDVLEQRVRCQGAGRGEQRKARGIAARERAPHRAEHGRGEVA